MYMNMIAPRHVEGKLLVKKEDGWRFSAKGSHHVRKTVKKVDNVRFG